MTLASFPFLYATLELPKLIVNDALSGKDSHRLYGMEFGQVDYLFLLCGLFLILVLINGGFKYVVNVYEGIVGERMLRRLRYELFSRVLRFPLPHFRHIRPARSIRD
jgi:ABC-type multidrug transport system fused ATPase/permease subunit